MNQAPECSEITVPVQTISCGREDSFFPKSVLGTEFGAEKSGNRSFPTLPLAVCSSCCAGSFADIVEATVFFTVFLDETTSNQILEFLVGSEAEHLLATAYCVASFQILVYNLKEIVKPEGLFICKHRHQFICYMIWNPS